MSMCQKQGSVLSCYPGGWWEGSNFYFGSCRTSRTISLWKYMQERDLKDIPLPCVDYFCKAVSLTVNAMLE